MVVQLGQAFPNGITYRNVDTKGGGSLKFETVQIWRRVTRDSGPRKTALERPSNTTTYTTDILLERTGEENWSRIRNGCLADNIGSDTTSALILILTPVPGGKLFLPCNNCKLQTGPLTRDAPHQQTSICLKITAREKYRTFA
jgi:hypothetical protein